MIITLDDGAQYSVESFKIVTATSTFRIKALKQGTRVSVALDISKVESADIRQGDIKITPKSSNKIVVE